MLPHSVAERVEKSLQRAQARLEQRIPEWMPGRANVIETEMEAFREEITALAEWCFLAGWRACRDEVPEQSQQLSK